MYRYAVELSKEPDEAYAVRIPALGVYTMGDDVADALVNAQDAADEAIAACITEGDVIPKCDAAGADYSVEISPYLILKAALYEGLRTSGLSKNALARQIGVGENEIRRMLDPKHSTKFQRMVDALEAVGRRVRVKIERPQRAA